MHYAIDGYVREDFVVIQGSLSTNGTRMLTPFDKLQSSDGEYYAKIDGSTGRLVVYNSQGKKEYAVGSDSAHTPKFYVLNTDGILSAVNRKNVVYWTSGKKESVTKRPFRLTMRKDGMLAIYNKDDQPVWASGKILRTVSNCTWAHC